MSQSNILGAPFEKNDHMLKLEKEIANQNNCFSLTVGDRPDSFEEKYEELEYVQTHLNMVDVHKSAPLPNNNRDLDIEKRIADREKHFILTGAYAYGGMGMDGNSPELLAEKHEEINYIRNHPDIYKTPEKKPQPFPSLL